MDLYSQMEALEVVILWLLMGVGSLLSLCLLLGVLFLLFCLLLKTLTVVFAYSEIDLWQNLEARFQSANQKGLLAVASLVAKFQTSEEDEKRQLSHLESKRKLVAEANALVNSERSTWPNRLKRFNGGVVWSCSHQHSQQSISTRKN
jgi:membrane protein required for beta-lactamase induction